MKSSKYLLIHTRGTNNYKLGILNDIMKSMTGTTEILGVFSENELPLAQRILERLVS
jgi:hypothetical protein